MKQLLTFTLCATLSSAPVLAQQPGPVAITAQLPGQGPEAALPANTELVVRMNDELSSKTAREGDTFGLSVAQDVMLNGYVVIPRGSRAVGEVTWNTGKGAFGKSGKMEIKVRYVEVSGQRVPLEGTFRQEGEGNTVATVAGVIAVGVFAAFITGKTAVIPRGRELTVHTASAIPVVLPRAAAMSGMARAPGLYAAGPSASSYDRKHGESCESYGRRVGTRAEVARLITDACKREG